MRVCLFEDRGVARLEPLTLTRPVFELLCGHRSLGVKQSGHFPIAEVGYLVRPHLAEAFRLQRPSAAVNDLAWLRAEPTVLVNGRWLPPPGPAAPAPEPGIALVDDEVAYVVLGPDQLTYCSPNTLDDCLETWKTTLPRRAAGGRVVSHLWELVKHNAEQLGLDFHQGAAGRGPGRRAGDLAVVGRRDALWVHPTAQLDPMIVTDTTRGPVLVDREAVVTAFTRLEGPCYVGPQTHVLGGKVRAGTTLGPNCRVGGEVEASILQGNTNKYHDGFLGHSYLGEWVNLGAGTQNSDLRNDYGEISVTVAGRSVPTGLTKVGCFVGDHSKTGVGTLLNAGTSVGVFCNLLPAGPLLPRHVPSFCSWWNGALTENADVPGLLRTAAEVMRRRGAELTAVHAALFRSLYDQTAPERHQALRETAPPRLRRSA
jgi:UDP-N-acetylglucosamine diphosphorylase/glucosamine-1-phosphate N-acetyltransferase